MSCILGSKSNKARVGERGNFLSRSLNLFRCAASSPLRSAEKSISRRNIARKRRPSLNIFRGNIPDPGPRATIFFSFFFFFAADETIHYRFTNELFTSCLKASFDARNDPTEGGGKWTDVRVCVDKYKNYIRIYETLTRYFTRGLFRGNEPFDVREYFKKREEAQKLKLRESLRTVVINERKNN